MERLVEVLLNFLHKLLLPKAPFSNFYWNMFRPTRGIHFAMAITGIHSAVVVFIVDGIYGYSRGNNSYYNYYSKVYINNS